MLDFIGIRRSLSDDGEVWSDLGAVDQSNPKLLFANDQTHLYFQPAENFHGQITDVHILVDQASNRFSNLANWYTGIFGNDVQRMIETSM